MKTIYHKTLSTTMTILEHPCSKDIRKLYPRTSVKECVARIVRIRNRRDQLNMIKEFRLQGMRVEWGKGRWMRLVTEVCLQFCFRQTWSRSSYLSLFCYCSVAKYMVSPSVSIYCRLASEFLYYNFMCKNLLHCFIPFYSACFFKEKNKTLFYFFKLWPFFGT